MRFNSVTDIGADPGQLTLIGDSWLVSADTGYKYPIRDGIPVMLVEEGARWKDTPVDALPVPPPPAAPAPPVNASASDIVQTSDEQTNLVVLAVAGGLLLLGGIVGISWLRSRSKSSDGS